MMREQFFLHVTAQNLGDCNGFTLLCILVSLSGGTSCSQMQSLDVTYCGTCGLQVTLFGEREGRMTKYNKLNIKACLKSEKTHVHCLHLYFLWQITAGCRTFSFHQSIDLFPSSFVYPVVNPIIVDLIYINR